jgi:hypothetical protein
MIREEAIAILKAFMENPLFNDVHKAAFNIAIHDIKAYHKWNLNELVLTQKDNEQEPILDKIRAEIEQTRKMYLDMNDIDWLNGCDYVLSVIDKYKAEKEDNNE